MTNSVLAKMQVIVSANMAEFGKNLAKGQSDLKNFTSGITKIAATVGIAFGAQQVASFALEVSKLAGQAEAVEAAFRRLSDSETLMKRLKEATGGTVSELELMKRAVMASNFDISLEALPRLLEFATLRAQQTGQSVDYLVDSIVTGIGRKSKLILDNLGISAAQLSAELKGVSTEASTVGEVADAVGRIAEKNLANMAGFSENAATKMQRLAASWENLKVAIGEAANGTGALGSALNFLNGILENLTKTFAEPSIQEYLKAAKELKELRQQAANKGDLEEWERINMFLEQALDKIRAYKLANDNAAKAVAANNEKVVDTEKKINLTLIERLALYDKFMKMVPVASGGVPLATPYKKTKEDTPFLDTLGNLVPPDISRFKELASEVKAVQLDLRDSTADFIGDMAETIGQALSGNYDFGKGFLMSLARFAGMFGKQLIALGVASLAARRVFLNPVAAIAAGVALTIAASAVAGSISKYNSGGTMSAGSGGSGISSRASIGGDVQREQRIFIDGVIWGKDIKLAYDSATQDNRIRRG